MGLDYIFVPVDCDPTSIKELEDFHDIKEVPFSEGTDFNVLMAQLFPDFQFDRGLGINEEHQLCCEVNAHESSLHFSMKGPGNPQGALERAQKLALPHQFVLIDVQTSEIFQPDDQTNQEYQEWYKRVMDQYD